MKFAYLPAENVGDLVSNQGVSVATCPFKCYIPLSRRDFEG
jgi:hypothetical protein